MSGSGKVGFMAGLCVGLLAGSRAGHGLYDRTAAMAGSLVHDPRVREGASTAVRRAGDAGTAVAGAAARQVKRVRGKDEDEEERGGHDASSEYGHEHERKGKADARAAARAAGARDASMGMTDAMPTAGASTGAGGARTGENMSGRGGTSGQHPNQGKHGHHGQQGHGHGQGSHHE